jgi:uridine phosphorylase
MTDSSLPPTPAPILANKHHGESPVFRPENLLREARRQRAIPPGDVPEICLLDPDGDILRWLLDQEQAHPCRFWACYHTGLYRFTLGGVEVGIIGNAVGGPFAVLLAEQLFVSGCKTLISITSAGRVAETLPDACFILIDRALRDEGTSYHYLPASDYADAPQGPVSRLKGRFDALSFPVVTGATWTTDAPYRETATAIAAMAARGILAVEMEAAALYAFAQARDKTVLCFAHVTNQMAQDGDDFEKGENDGARASLAVVSAVIKTLPG